MADVDIENRGTQAHVSKSKREEYLERFAKFKEDKKKEPLQEKNKPQNISGQKRKSCPDSTNRLPLKKSRENTAITPRIKNGPANNKQDLQKTSKTPSSSTGLRKENSTSKKEETPMSLKLQRWKEEKEKRKTGEKLKTSTTCSSESSGVLGKSTSTQKHQSGGPRPLQKTPHTGPRQTGQTAEKTSAEVSTVGKVNKWDRLTKGSSVTRKSLHSENKPKTNRLGNKNIASNTARRSVISARQAETKGTRPKFPGTQGHSNKYHKSLQSPVSKKVERNRRHSEVQSRGSPLKRPGILKRKSCIASFSDTDNVVQTDGTPVIDGVAALSRCGRVGQNTEEFDANHTPENSRTVRFFSPRENRNDVTFRKTPAKQKEDENSMRNKLNDWLKAKGKTPSKFRHLMCFDAKMSAKKKTDPKAKRSLTVEELTEQQETMEREDRVSVNLADEFERVADDEDSDRKEEEEAMDKLHTILEECSILFEAGCPYTDILKWLDSIQQNIPLAKKTAAFYICKARVLQVTTDLDKVLQVYEDAVVNNAQPAKELASALTEIVKEVSAEREKKALQRSVKKRVQEENIFESTSIKYCVRQVTPFSKRSRRSTGSTSEEAKCTVVTPVRRSTRRSLASLPSNLQEKTPAFTNLDELSDVEKKKTVYKDNAALEPLLLDLSDSVDNAFT